MVTGQMPFGEDSTEDALNKHITGYLPSPQSIDPGVSVSVVRLITRLMMKAPTDRYASWDEVLEDIKKAASGKTTASIAAPSGNSTISSAQGAAPRAGKRPSPSGRVAVAGAAPRPQAPTVPPTDKFTPAAAGVAPAADAKPVVRPKSKRAAAARAAARAAAKQPAKPAAKPIPKAVRIVAWTILCTWWAGLAALLFGKPEIIRQFLPDSEAYLPSKPKPEEPPPAAPEPGPDGVVEPDNGVKPPVPEGGQASQTQPDQDKQGEPAVELLPGVKTKLAGLLAAQDFQKALTLLDEEAKSRPDETELDEIAKLKDFVTKVATMDSAVRAAFTAKAGETVVLNYKNRHLQIELRAVSGDKINGLLLVKTAGGVEKKPITFPLSRLEPLERARWLGSANTPDRCAMKYILHLQGGDIAAARTYAANSGPLSSAFAERLKEVPE